MPPGGLAQATAGRVQRPDPQSAPVALSAVGVHKAFALPHERHTSLRERAAHGFRSVEFERFEALGGVSFDIHRGEFFGIIGRNGSGKSSLLKIAAGIYSADRGRVEVTGRLSPFIEMGVGFKPELTARENVMLNGAMMGLTRSEIRARFDDILAFAELEEFVDLKLKNYSSGMNIRLAFSMAIQVDADVLLIDEVLAVGDASFQAKCFAHFDRLKQEGRTVVFVTHSMEAVERYCHRAVLLDAGQVTRIGPADEVAEAYREVNEKRAEERAVIESGRGPARLGPPSARAAQPVPAKPVTFKPTALGRDLRRFGRLSAELAWTDIREHYQDSVLGFVWSVLRPLAFFAVLYGVFSRAAGLGHGVKDYGFYLLFAIVLWTFCAETVSEGLVSLVGGSQLLRKVRFPRLIIPAAVVVESLFNLAMNIVAASLFLVLVHPQPRLSWLELPLFVVVLTMFAAGLTLLLSTLYVRFRDTQQLWSVAQQLLFFSSPILYVASRVPESLQGPLNLSPLSVIFTQMRHALVDPSAPTAAESVGGTGFLAVPAVIVLGTFALGLWVFWREAPRLAERL